MSQAEIMQCLNDLLRMEDVLACMLAKRGLEGVVPQGIKVKNADLWQLIKRTTDDLFGIIEKFYDYGLSRVYVELGDYTMIIATVTRSFSLIVVIPGLANQGLIDVEVENTKRKIAAMIKGQQEGRI